MSSAIAFVSALAVVACGCGSEALPPSRPVDASIAQTPPDLAPLPHYTIEGKRVIHWWNDQTDEDQTYDTTQATIQVLVPSDKGAFTTVEGLGSVDGTRSVACSRSAWRPRCPG